jgi:hypothetical protein
MTGTRLNKPTHRLWRCQQLKREALQSGKYRRVRIKQCGKHPVIIQDIQYLMPFFCVVVEEKL